MGGKAEGKSAPATSKGYCGIGPEHYYVAGGKVLRREVGKGNDQDLDSRSTRFLSRLLSRLSFASMKREEKQSWEKTLSSRQRKERARSKEITFWNPKKKPAGKMAGVWSGHGGGKRIARSNKRGRFVVTKKKNNKRFFNPLALKVAIRHERGSSTEESRGEKKASQATNLVGGA